MTQPLVPVSVGELIDKITILEIKSERITDPDKNANVARELAALGEVWSRVAGEADLSDLRADLKRVNQKLWNIEDRIRRKEAKKRFDEDFIELARAVYHSNDERARIKRAINEAIGSALVEEKSYEAY